MRSLSEDGAEILRLFLNIRYALFASQPSSRRAKAAKVGLGFRLIGHIPSSVGLVSQCLSNYCGV